MVVGIWGVKAGRLDEGHPDSRENSQCGCGQMKPPIMGSIPPIVQEMGGAEKDCIITRGRKTRWWRNVETRPTLAFFSQSIPS